MTRQHLRNSNVRVDLRLFLTLLVSGIGVADNTDTMEWDPSRQLTWEDFAGPVPGGTEEQRVAATAASLAWSFEYTIEWSLIACKFRIDSIDSLALFHRDSSWVRDNHRRDAVLQHEQGHFDILQLHKLKFEAATREFVGSFRSCRGRNERSATRDTKEAIDRLVGPIYDSAWGEYRAEQEAYDAQTRHGTDAAAQSEWTGRIARRLATTMSK